MFTIFFSKDYYYLQSHGFAVAPHHHLPLQISLAEPEDHVLWGGRTSAGVLIGRDQTHSVDTVRRPMHTFLLNPTHPRTRLLNSVCPTWQNFEPSLTIRRELSELEVTPDKQEQLDRILRELIQQLTPSDREPEPLDERIAEVVDYIDGLEQKKVGAAELAERIALSESRFLHLFKDEMEVTIRQYLLWVRTRVGARLVVEGSTITEAAHQAGFTDSAHFSKVFRRMFGATLSSVLTGDSAPKLVVSAS